VDGSFSLPGNQVRFLFAARSYRTFVAGVGASFVVLKDAQKKSTRKSSHSENTFAWGYWLRAEDLSRVSGLSKNHRGRSRSSTPMDFDYFLAGEGDRDGQEPKKVAVEHPRQSQ
jgi:hypothetical protein